MHVTFFFSLQICNQWPSDQSTKLGPVLFPVEQGTSNVFDLFVFCPGCNSLRWGNFLLKLRTTKLLVGLNFISQIPMKGEIQYEQFYSLTSTNTDSPYCNSSMEASVLNLFTALCPPYCATILYIAYWIWVCLLSHAHPMYFAPNE